ncbi:hypothetical protein [Butyrivibrio sp. LC3010]|uniref:hypothetical protein n=1 Tax=Butyrivibrio sp. LC3010 TaxID=1280680 RepID=UPI0003FE51A8|nr:hypothetical protein [Butyrivibrio sp. LC3010]
MFRNLYADTRNVLFSRGFHTGILAVIVYQLFYLVCVSLIYFFLKDTVAAEDVAFVFPSMAAFLVTASTLYLTDREFSDGCIRNKLISGVKRSDAFLSAVCTGMMQGAIYAFVAAVLSTVVAVMFTGGFVTFSVNEIADYWLILTLACMAVGAFSTSLIMMLGGSKASYVVGLAIAFALKVYDTFILDKLYPEKGFCQLSGFKLLMYRFIDRFIPYSYFSTVPHYDMGSYVIGCAGMILISVVAGLLVFNRKQIK